MLDATRHPRRAGRRRYVLTQMVSDTPWAVAGRLRYPCAAGAILTSLSTFYRTRQFFLSFKDITFFVQIAKGKQTGARVCNSCRHSLRNHMGSPARASWLRTAVRTAALHEAQCLGATRLDCRAQARVLGQGKELYTASQHCSEPWTTAAVAALLLYRKTLLLWKCVTAYGRQFLGKDYVDTLRDARGIHATFS